MDYYAVLQVDSDASQEDIKKAYQQLILRHHPDKAEDGGGTSDIFIKIDEAFKVLKDPELRKVYDSKRFQQNSHMIIHDTVQSDEFSFDESNEVHYFTCKCGGWYILDEESKDTEYIICCDECSLVIKVINVKKSDGS